MATIRTEVELEAAAAEAWAVIGEFGAAADLAPGFVTACRVEDDERIVTFASGLVVREKLVTRDEDRRRLVYSARGGRADHHNAVVEVIARNPERSVMRWTVDVLPDAIAPLIQAMMEEGGAAISGRFSSQPAEAAA